jgi:spermidine synthase
VSADEVIADASDAPAARRLAAYWTARQRFIEIGRAVRPSGDAAAMLSQVREPLLGVLRISADFRPAYDPLLRMAMALGHGDPLAARSLLSELDRLAPVRDEAREGLRRLDATP